MRVAISFDQLVDAAVEHLKKHNHVFGAGSHVIEVVTGNPRYPVIELKFDVVPKKAPAP